MPAERTKKIAFNKTINADAQVLGFGELALLYQIKRTATVSASSQCEVWKLPRQEFIEVIGTKESPEDIRKLAILDGVRLFD